jgi:hypothetical protein
MLDVGLTLHGQPANYWAGDYARTTEGASFYRRLYALHPAAGVGGQVLFICLVAGLLVMLPEVLAVVLAIAVVLGNTYGASTWVTAALVSRTAWGQPTPVNWYQASNGMFLAAAVVVGVGVHWVVRSSAMLGRVEARSLAGWQRWVLVSLLLVGIAVIVFVPW